MTKKLSSKTSYIRPSRGRFNKYTNHFVVFVFDSVIQTTEKFVCKGIRILGASTIELAKVIEDNKERLWIITEGEVDMNEAKEYSKNPSWNNEAMILDGLEEEDSKEEKKDND